MDWLYESIIERIRQELIQAVLVRFQNMFNSINGRISGIAADVWQTPMDWNSSIFNMIRDLSETVVLPIAGTILTFVACYELIQMIISQNNMQNFETFTLYKWMFKTAIAVFILTNTFSIVMGVFGLAQEVVNQSAGLITGTLEVSLEDTLAELEAQLEDMPIWELIGLWLETFIVSFCLQVMSIVIFIVIFGRMLEIYLTVSIAPIPLATMTSRDWSQMGNNYLKSLFALGFQGFLIMVCVAIYAALVQTIPSADNPHAAIWTVLGYTVLLCFCLFKTGSLAKAMFNAH
ncbi:MAG: CD0415/CD1112 family protein [Defluviitaleaceae bacterium]|nr:CD0415/CD1112 family protein [Defluviitaleaceae bacterium]